MTVNTHNRRRRFVAWRSHRFFSFVPHWRLTGVTTAAVAFLTGSSLFADTINGTGWKGTVNNGTANTGNWTAANWDSTAPNTSGTGDRNLFFGQGYKAAGGTNFISNNDLTNWHGYRMTFQDSNAAGNGTDGSSANDTAFTITGNAFGLFDFSGNAPRIQNDSFLTQTFNLGGLLTLSGTNGGGTAAVNANNANLLFNNTLDLAGTTQLQMTGSKTTTFNGVISSTGSSGNNSVVITGGGTAVYGAVNTYNGDTFVNNGTLQIASGGGLSSASAIRLGNTATGSGNATLAFTSLTGGLSIGSIVNPGFAGGTGTYLIDSQNTSNTNTISGNIFLDSNLRIQQATGGTLAITNATLDLKGNTLSLNTGATGNTGLLGNINITGVIGNSTGSGQLVVGSNGFANSAGTVTLSNANTYTGETFVRNGTLAFTSAGSSNNSTIRFGSTSGTSVNANINLTTSTGGTMISSTVNPVSTTGSGTLTINSQNTSNTNTFSGHFGLDRNLTINQAAGGTLNLTAAHTTAITDGSTGFDAKNFTVDVTGSGTVNFNDIGNYSGNTNPGNATLQSDNTGAVSLGGTHDNNALAVTVNSGNLTLNKTSSGTVHALGSGLTVNSGGTVLLGNNTGDQIYFGSFVTINNGGTVKTQNNSEGSASVTATAANSGVGALTLQRGSTIDFGSGSPGSTLSAASGVFDSSVTSGLVAIKDWTGLLGQDNGSSTNDRLLFASNPGWTPTQLAEIQFYDDSGNTLGTGAEFISYINGWTELVPVPEPSTWAAGALACAVIGYQFSVIRRGRRNRAAR